ncbi:hypothetical protein Tco_0304388 [Tanacetum coccineum]
MLFCENRINLKAVVNYIMRVHDPSLRKIILDVDFFYGKRNESVYWSILLELIDYKLFSRTFNTSKLFSTTFNTSEPSLRNIKKCRVLKLQALAQKDKSTRGNTGNVYASGTTHTFNLDPNVRFNLSFNLPAIERDITNDDDVKFFIDCATNSITDEIPHLYIRPPIVEARIIPGPVEVNKDVSKDDHFMQGPWLQSIVYLHGEGVIVSGCLDDMKKNYIKGKLELVVGVVKSC